MVMSLYYLTVKLLDCFESLVGGGMKVLGSDHGREYISDQFNIYVKREKIN